MYVYSFKVKFMKLSKKSDYALRAMMTRASDSEILFSIRSIAEQNDIPRRFLEHIMLDLKNKGWVKAVTGRDGGYTMAVAPSEVTVGAIVRLFDEMLAPIECVSVKAYSKCTQEHTCKFRRLFLNLRNQAATTLDGTTLADLQTFEPVSAIELRKSGFTDGEGI